MFMGTLQLLSIIWHFVNDARKQSESKKDRKQFAVLFEEENIMLQA